MSTILCPAEHDTLSGPIFNARIAAGWRLEGDESGNHWSSPTGIHESEWVDGDWDATGQPRPLPEADGDPAFIASRPDLAG